MDASLAPHGLAAATALLLLAGLADSLGDRAVVLLVNRITPRAFTVTLLASALLFAAAAALWIAGAWLAATTIFGVHDNFSHFYIVLSPAYIPFLLSALALLPLLGPVLRSLLRLGNFGLGLVLLVLLGLDLWEALLCAACGTLLLLGINWLFSEPAGFVARRLWAALAGHPRPLRSHLPHAIPGYAPSLGTNAAPEPGATPEPGAVPGEQAPA